MDRPKGLEGKTYSTWEIPTELATLKTVVEDDGGNFDRVKLIPNDITDEPAAFSLNRCQKQTSALPFFAAELSLWNSRAERSRISDTSFAHECASLEGFLFDRT